MMTTLCFFIIHFWLHYLYHFLIHFNHICFRPYLHYDLSLNQLFFETSILVGFHWLMLAVTCDVVHIIENRHTPFGSCKIYAQVVVHLEQRGHTSMPRPGFEHGTPGFAAEYHSTTPPRTCKNVLICSSYYHYPPETFSSWWKWWLEIS